MKKMNVMKGLISYLNMISVNFSSSYIQLGWGCRLEYLSRIFTWFKIIYLMKLRTPSLMNRYKFSNDIDMN